MNEIFNTFAQAVGGKLVALGLLTFIDLLFGVVLSIRQGRFSWGKLTGYLDSDVLPALAWLAVEALALIPSGLIPPQAVTYAPQLVYGTVFLKIMASVAGHFSALGVLTSPLQRVGISPTGGLDEDHIYLDDFRG